MPIEEDDDVSEGEKTDLDDLGKMINDEGDEHLDVVMHNPTMCDAHVTRASPL